MCRHLAYLGPPATLRSVLIDPPYGLYRQSWAPRRQRHGTVNADGFGVGWYAAGDPVPARYRRGCPIWGDPSLADLARVTRSTAVLAAVRDASPGTAAGDQAAAPFGADQWLFSHNGRLDGWPDSAAAHAPNARTMLSLEAMVDSAFLWALVLEWLQAGAAMDTALAATITAIEAGGGSGRFNFLVTDGPSIAATAWGDTLWYRRSAATVVVASEPGDDQPGWTEVPDRHSLTATPAAVTVRPLATDLPGFVAPAVHRSHHADRSTAPTTTSATKGS
jgi:gamma-glutamyl hercynylcysteine S-oxide hydrolase